MFFTREDINKIYQALLKLGIKDSELPETSDVKNDDTLAIVQDGKNKQINIREFLNQISLWKREDFINVTDKYKKSYITLVEAIQAIPIVQRKEGLVITFLDTENNWRIYQFRGSLLQFNNETLWVDLYDFSPYIIDPILPDEEDITQSAIDEQGNTYLSLKDREYNPSEFSGKGYKILRKNIIEIEDENSNKVNKNILTQDMINEPNTVYEIRYDFDLNGAEIQIKDGCVLNFVGGSLSNGKLNGINVKLNTDDLNSSLINITYNNKFIWNKNSTYFIEPKLWGITEGYFEKDENGHYSEAQYQRMYENGIGFTNAIEWAYKNNYKGVVFKRGDYCFCSRLNSAGRSRACIFVRNIIDFDINLGGAKLYLLKDSDKQSPYSEITLDDPFAERGIVIMMQMVKNVQIHDGEIIGDRFLRNYTNIKESQFDKTNGIMQEGFCYNTKLYNLSIRNFMGDAIALWIGGNFLIYEDYNTLKTIGQNIKISSRKYVETRFLSGVKNEVTSYRNNVGCTITDYIDLKNFYNNITVNENYKILEYFKKNRLYSFISQGTTINAYWTKIDILTFNETVSTEIPIRVIPSELYGVFQLNKGETGIKIQFYYDYTDDVTNTPTEPILFTSYISTPLSHNIIIDNCTIEECNRGGIFGGINSTTISNCLFRKNISNNTPHIDENGAYPDYYQAGTNYSVDWEDSYSKDLDIHNCVFYGAYSRGSVLLGVSNCVIYNNKFIGANLTLYNNILSIIKNNYFIKANIKANKWINSGIGAFNVYANDNKYGLSNLKRYIYFSNNIVEGNNENLLSGISRNDVVSISNNHFYLSQNSSFPDCDDLTLKKAFGDINVYKNTVYVVSERNNNTFLCVGNWFDNIIKKKSIFYQINVLNSTLSFKNNKVIDVKTSTVLNYNDDTIYINDKTFFGVVPNDTIVINIPKTAVGKKFVFTNCEFNNSKIQIYNAIDGYLIFEFYSCKINNTLANNLNKDSNSSYTFNFVNCNFIELKEPLFAIKQKVDVNFKNCRTNNLQLYANDTKSIVDKHIGDSNNRPTVIPAGFQYFDETLKKYIVWNGTEWTSIDSTDLDTPTDEWITIE